jgi:hypothetical protein
MKQIFIIGAGGVGSWLTPAMCLLTDQSAVTVIDGDKLEEKNLNRQLFSIDDCEKFKAEVLAKYYNCGFINRFYTHGSIAVDRGDWLLCAADNNLARKAVLMTVDETGAQAILGCNERLSSEAYYYRRDWKGTHLDPRKYYPEIETDDSNDPRSAAIGCTGLAQKETPQLVSANFAAASHMMHLYALWAMERPKMNREAAEHLPHQIIQNMTSVKVVKKASFIDKPKGKIEPVTV